MSVSASQLRRLNRRFGEAFGFNPHGQPNFRWARTETMSFFVDHGSGYRRRDSGLLTFEKQFERRPWSIRYGNCWILTKWRHYSEEEWYAMVGLAMPYPKHGDWVPIENVRLGPQYPEHPDEPTEEATLDAIAAIKHHRLQDAREFVEEPDRLHKLAMKSHINKIGDELDDLRAAFDNVPGSRAHHVQFQS